MKKSLYFFDIGEKNGLYVYEKDESLHKSLQESFILKTPSLDNLDSIYDIAINITDEETDIILIKLNDNCTQFIYAIIQILFKENIKALILLCPKLEQTGYFSIQNNICYVINSIDQLSNFNAGSYEYVISEVLDPVLLYNNETAIAMKNGIDAMITGSYISTTHLTNFKHVLIEDNVDIPFEKISPELLNINSALIYNNYDANRFTDLKEKKNGIFMHIHQLEGNTIRFDNMKEKSILNCVKYSEFDASTPSYVQLLDEDDINCFADDIEYFKKTGKIRKFGIRLFNECAWGISSCQLLNLYRCSIDRHLNVYPCHGCRKRVGNFTDEYFELMRSTAAIAKKERTKRQCSNCDCNKTCPKCVMLPENIALESYCQLIRSQGASDYMYKTIVLGSMFKNSTIFNGRSSDDIIISSRFRPLVASLEEIDATTDSRPTNHSTMIAFLSEDLYYVFSYKVSKIYCTDARFTYIAELCDAAVPYEEIIKLYMNKYSFTHKESENHVVEALTMVKEAIIA